MRGPSSKKYLKLDWQYPVYSEPLVEVAEGESVAKRARRALSREEALAYIAGNDPRPLLVLRECLVCNGTDDALLKPGADNEKTFLFSRWFHCVKLPPDVMAEDHPFHNLFQQEQPEHLFLSSVDGKSHMPLESQNSRVELWQSMQELLSIEYAKRPDSSLKKIAMLLDKMDVVDRRAVDLERRRDELLEVDGPDSKKVRKLQAQLREVQEEREQLDRQVEKYSELELKQPEEAR